MLGDTWRLLKSQESRPQVNSDSLMKLSDAKVNNPRQVLSRAAKQLKALNKADRRFTGSRAYALAKSRLTEDGDDFGIIYVDSCQPIPDDIPRLVGDICETLRSALDMTLLQVWGLQDSTPSEPVSIPIFDAAAGFEKAISKQLSYLSSEQQKVLESVQPYVRGNPYLSIIRDLSEADQHRLNPVISTTSIVDQVKLRGMISPAGKFRFIVNVPTPALAVGTELLRIPLGEFVGDIDVDRKFKYWQVFGGDPQICEGLNVVDTLTVIKNEVGWVVDQFNSFFKP